MARGFSSRHLIPPNNIAKTGSKKTSEVDKLTIIPTWMKKPKIKRFQDSMGNVKNKNQNTPQNKNLHEFNIPGSKFKLNNVINKKSKTMHSMTEALKPKKFYKTVMNKISLPHFETKHLVLKKKNNKKESYNSQSRPEDSVKEVINANIPENNKLTVNRCIKTDHTKNMQARETMKLEYIKNSPEPLVAIENNLEKSLMVVPENKPKQRSKNDDRSRIRKHKKKNVIAEKDENLLKLKARHFEKPELDMFIKKLAAKYGKTVVQKSTKPKRIYENNRPRIKYDLDSEKYVINTKKAGPMAKQETTNKKDAKISHYSKKKLSEFIKKDIENRKILKKGNNLVNQRTLKKVEEKPERVIILRKEDLTAHIKSQNGDRFLNKKSNSAIKLNQKNGLLKDRDKHIMSAEKRKQKLETENFSESANVRDDVKSKECTNGPEIKNINCCQNKKKYVEDHVIPYSPKIKENPLIIVNSGSKKLQKELMPSIDQNYICKKPGDKTQILPDSQSNNKIKLMISEKLSNKRNEHPAKIENTPGETKNKQAKDQSTGTLEDQSSDPKNKDKGQQLASKFDSRNKPTEQMKYMKYTPDSPNYICAPKQRNVSCKYKMSRGVHSDKPDIFKKSKKNLRNTQTDLNFNTEISLHHRSDDYKIKNKEATAINVNENIPSKVDLVKTVDKKLMVPMNIYEFQCHSKSLDYKVYKYDSIPSISLKTKQSNTTKPNTSDTQIGNLEKINAYKRRRHQCFESKRKQSGVKNGKWTNVNAVRIRLPPIVNFKNPVLTIKKEVAPITAKQPAHHSVSPTKGENLPLVPKRVLDTKEQTFDSDNQSKPNSKVPRQMEGKKVIHSEKVEDEKNPLGKEKENVKNLHLSILTSDIEKSYCVEGKTAQSLNLKEQIKDEDVKVGERASCINENKIFLSRSTRELQNPEEYNIDYSRRELKKILPFLKNLNNKTIDICSKEDKNLVSIESKEKQGLKEKKFFMEPETNLNILGNTHTGNFEIPNKNHFLPFISAMKNKSGLNNKLYSPNLFCTTYSEENSKKDDLKAKENPKCEVEKKKQSEYVELGNHIESNPSSSQQLAERSLEGRIKESKPCNSEIKKNILPTFNYENKREVNVSSHEDTTYKQKKGELEAQQPTMIIGMQTKQHKTQPVQKPTFWIDKFHELVVNKPILNEKVKKNVFLMHGFNKVSFVKVSEDIHHITSEMTILPKHIPMIARNVNEGEHSSKNKINDLQVLENDLKEMLYQHLQIYNREIKHKYPEIIKQNKNLKIYDLHDSTFILQGYNKATFNCESPKNLVEENLNQPRTSLNDFEFIDNTSERKFNKTVPIQAETNKNVSDIMKQIKTCGGLNVKQDPKDISFTEILDSRVPIKSTKSAVKESSTDEIGSQKFSLMNTKHMCFYSKYRMNCMEENVIMKRKTAIIDQKPERKNSIATKTNIQQDSMTSNNVNYLKSIPKSSCQGTTILPVNMKMLTFREIYDYNHKKSGGTDDRKNKVNIYSELEGKGKTNLGTKKNLEKESLNLKREDKDTNHISSDPNRSHSFSLKKNLIRDEIEPEVLYYMKKLNILPLNNGFPMQSLNTNTLEKSFCSNKPNEYSSYNIKKVSDHNKGDVTKTENLFIREISYSTDIKFLKKNTTELSDVINECRRGTFEYLTKVVKKSKTDTKNLSSLVSTNINEQQEKSENHKDVKNIEKFPSKYLKLPYPTLKMTKEKGISKNRSDFLTVTNFVSNESLKGSNDNKLNCSNIDNLMLEASKNDKELNITSPNIKTVSLNKNMKDEYIPRINPNKNEDISTEFIENSANKLEVMKNVKEQEKQLYHQRNLENTLSQIKNYECDKTGDAIQITSSNKKLKLNNELKTEDVPAQNELKSSVNIESTNKKSPHNGIYHVQKNKIESVTQMRPTKGMLNNVIMAGNSSFKSLCIKTGEELKESNNIMKTTSINKQNYNNSNRARKKSHLDSDNKRISNNLNKSVCKVHTVLNKKYASRLQDVNKEIQSNLLLTRNEAKNHIKASNYQKGSINFNKMTEKDMINGVTVKEQKEVEKFNISEVTKPITMEFKNNDLIADIDTKLDVNIIEVSKPVKNEQDDLKTIINKKIDRSNSDETYITESIPTGLRCIRQLTIEAHKDKGMDEYNFKKPLTAADSIKLKGRERKRIKSPLRKEIGKSVTIPPPTLTADCSTNSNLNQYSLKHKKQYETIIQDKRVRLIKNKLSNNLRSKDESKIISRQTNSLMSFINAESGKKKTEDNKRDPKKGKEEGLHSQKNSMNRISFIPESKEQTGLARSKIVKAPETGNFSDTNFFLENPSLCSESNFKQINEYKNDGFSKAENRELNFIQQEANGKKEKNKDTNNIGSTLSLHSLKKNMKLNQKTKFREHPIYILKAQPKKVEGFISQTLRSSNSQKCPSSKTYTGAVKKQQTGHLTKHRIKSELKQSVTSLKKKKSKYRILKNDLKFKNEQKKNQNNMKVASSSIICSQKRLPVHVFQKEQKKLGKNYALDTPSRQVCVLTPPIRTPKEKPMMPKPKVITKLTACTQKKDDHKENLKAEKNVKKNREDNVFFISNIDTMKPGKEYKSTFKEICKIDKGKTSVQNLSEYQLEKSKDRNTNLVRTKDLISNSELTINQSKPTIIHPEKVPEGNEISNCELLTNSKGDIGLPSIVGNVVNNVKTRIQNFLLADIAKSKLNRGITSKKKRQQEIEDLKQKSYITKNISRKKNGLLKLYQNTNDATNQVQLNKKIKKKKSKNRGVSHRRKTISDLLRFKPVRNKRTCPQMSYSEVLNQFYAGCET